MLPVKHSSRKSCKNYNMTKQYPQTPHILISQCTQVIVIESEKETGGFLAPSITVLAREGWKSGATLEKCPKRLSKLDSHFIELRKNFLTKF